MRIDHDRDWIIGCIKHDGFIKTDRFDKANQIILDALSVQVAYVCDGRSCNDDCTSEECTHTKDIEHAKNFMRIGDAYMEQTENAHGDLISRAELFNRLAAVHAPMEANEYKAAVYRIINEIGGGHHDQL